MKKKVLSIILIIIFTFSSINVFAVSSEYQDAENKKNEAQNQLDDVQNAKSQALQEIQELEQSIEQAENEIEQLDTKINNLTTSINEKTKQIEEKEKEYKEKEELFKQRMAILYEAGQTSYLEVLLTSKNITDFISKYYIMSEIAEADSEVLNEIETTKSEIEETKKNLEDEKNELDEAKKQKTEKNNKLITSKNEKQSKIDSLTDEEKELQNKIDEYNNKMKEITEAERKAAAATASSSTSTTSSGTTAGAITVTGTGQFTWPVPGYRSLSSYFGYRIHPIYGTYQLHTGIDIAAPLNAQFVAADDGVVILASYGYNGGYGNYVVISHANGITTRYAHGTTVLVTTGQTVTKGTPVLTVGSTGASTGPHAHFEVRVNGVAVNPLNYL